MKAHNRYAFTLVELAIVLVVIGLLVGGVLVGRDLITAARLRSISNQKEYLLQAVNVFRLKYGALPGDMAPAETAKLDFFTFTNSGRASLTQEPATPTA